MKKTVFAAALLALLTAVSVWNLRHLKGLTDELSGGIESARTLWQADDFSGAENAVDEALEHWLAADGYTHIFIRHSEIDAATDVFYDLRGDILAGDKAAAEASAEKLLYHLRSIYSMEQISMKSIF